MKQFTEITATELTKDPFSMILTKRENVKSGCQIIQIFFKTVLSILCFFCYISGKQENLISEHQQEERFYAVRYFVRKEQRKPL